MKYLNKADFDFPTTTIYSKKDISKVQQELLLMMKEVGHILENNNIPYLISFGTLIGAVKFGGFLPWDDDIDIFLFDDTYEQAIELLKNNLSPHLIVHGCHNDANYFLAWNSVKNINTKIEDNDIYNPDNKKLSYQCLGIDMYRLKQLKRSEIQNYKIEEAVGFFERKYISGLITKDEYQINIDKLSKQQAASSNVIDNLLDDKDVLCFILKMQTYLKLEDVFPLRKYKFEDTYLYGPNNYDAVLTASFGEWYSMPLYSERKPHLKRIEFI